MPAEKAKNCCVIAADMGDRTCKQCGALLLTSWDVRTIHLPDTETRV